MAMKLLTSTLLGAPGLTLVVVGVPELTFLSRGGSFVEASASCLKNPGGGKKMHSVFEALPFRPICISKPICF